jgi:hypothetical protein
MSIMEPVAGVRLERPAEPVTMRAGLRDTMLGGVRQDDASSNDIGLWLWDRWRPTLEPMGMDREAFIEVTKGFRRELWLWLMGERQWDQLVDGLAGRVARRLPTI